MCWTYHWRSSVQRPEASASALPCENIIYMEEEAQLRVLSIIRTAVDSMAPPPHAYWHWKVALGRHKPTEQSFAFG